MTTVIVPALGRDMATPYADGQIKLLAINVCVSNFWRLSHPNRANTTQPSGRPLIVDSISSLDFRKASTIIVAVPEPLVLHHAGSKSEFEALFSSLPASTVSKLRFHYATTPTIDAVDTVTSIISALSITGPIFIKDADNDFAHSIDVGNYLTYLSIVKDQDPLSPAPKWDGRPDLIDATKKSYVSFSYDNIISNIAYGSFVSSQFCCGGWSFISAEDFVAAATKLRHSIQRADIGATNGNGSSSRGTLKVLDILWQLVCDGHLFFGAKVGEYEDWGSRMAWEAYANQAPSRDFREDGNGVSWGGWVGGLVPRILKRNISWVGNVTSTP